MASSRSRPITSRAKSTAPDDTVNSKRYLTQHFVLQFVWLDTNSASQPAPRAINKSKSYKNLKDEYSYVVCVNWGDDADHFVCW